MKVRVEYGHTGSKISGKIWENNTTEILDVNKLFFVNNYYIFDYLEYLSDI